MIQFKFIFLQEVPTLKFWFYNVITISFFDYMIEYKKFWPILFLAFL